MKQELKIDKFRLANWKTATREKPVNGLLLYSQSNRSSLVKFI